jgi:hypothetical protein
MFAYANTSIKCDPNTSVRLYCQLCIAKNTLLCSTTHKNDDDEEQWRGKKNNLKCKHYELISIIEHTFHKQIVNHMAHLYNNYIFRQKKERRIHANDSSFFFRLLLLLFCVFCYYSFTLCIVMIRNVYVACLPLISHVYIWMVDMRNNNNNEKKNNNKILCR